MICIMNINVSQPYIHFKYIFDFHLNWNDKYDNIM